ncbi:AzlD family protein [Desulfofustis limnaeus]|jgi:uncharacterized membrane protein|uniref:AzlD domain-containing protein n=1 Tax=Desulfofustis limnaeus TaxID=2740163 RepID=A0ABM7WDB3_9BACT|nr:AzlD domain-containing protein [Desulfofustis limnaeus]MDX9894034.1 AzlD domain-containing protein [Desulfofustis sp.]BDD88979.1 hypothetical protein DPPLL_33440 [Desulfofustis limnaeus]
MTPENSLLVWLTIGAAAVVTYGLRISGLLLAGRLPKTGKFRTFMDALPGTILLSLIVPAAVAAGPVGWLATVVTGLCSIKTGNVFISMLVGVAIVAIGRGLGW